jgi:hypothetical protein
MIATRPAASVAAPRRVSGRKSCPDAAPAPRSPALLITNAASGVAPADARRAAPFITPACGPLTAKSPPTQSAAPSREKRTISAFGAARIGVFVLSHDRLQASLLGRNGRDIL